MTDKRKKVNRREFLTKFAAAAVYASGLPAITGCAGKKTKTTGKKVIVLGIDGMDPVLSETMMRAGQLPNLNELRRAGGYRRLGTSIPPQSPVAWANFINGAGPGTHGIFDFIHRDPARQCYPFFSAAQTIPSEGYWETDEHKLPLTFWPFNHVPARTVLQRKGVPFWEYLDEAGIPSQFYDLPSNYPPSHCEHGHHRCLAGMGVPDLQGTYGTYQYFEEQGPPSPQYVPGGVHSRLVFQNETAEAQLIGPQNDFLKKPEATKIKFHLYRDLQSKAAAIDIQSHKILLSMGQWSEWIKLDFCMPLPGLLPDEHVAGICRFYLQEVGPNFRLYVTPVNIDPSDPAIQISEPEKFSKNISSKLGLFYTAGFQEDHKALSNKVFTDDEFIHQAGLVLQERLNLLEYALDNFEDGLLFFYFSSTDLQAHMLWWDSNAKHPVRSPEATKSCFKQLKKLYQNMDQIVGRICRQYGNDSMIMVLSDHGFANFSRQFNLNSWLREEGYIHPPNSTSILRDVDWSRTRAYGLGINGLYLNLKGREREGIVEPGEQREELLQELIDKLKNLRDEDGTPVIREAHRTDKIYHGPHTALAPDLIIGYRRGYRASWATCLGDMTEQILLNNDSAWSADHCADHREVPGVLFCNRPIKRYSPALTDLAPTILKQFGVRKPNSMIGADIFSP